MTDTAQPTTGFDRDHLVAPGPHPLKPLSAREISRAVEILRAERALSGTVRSTVELHEPSKADVLDWPLSGPVAREAFAIVMDRADGAVHEAIVSLDAGTVTDWRHLPGIQPRIMAEEFVECEELLKRCPEYLEALAKRGITDPELLMVDPWSAGSSEGTDTRYSRALAWVRSEEGDNGYARPVEGLIAFVDLANMRVCGSLSAPPFSGYIGQHQSARGSPVQNN